MTKIHEAAATTIEATERERCVKLLRDRAHQLWGKANAVYKLNQMKAEEFDTQATAFSEAADLIGGSP